MTVARSYIRAVAHIAALVAVAAVPMTLQATIVQETTVVFEDTSATRTDDQDRTLDIRSDVGAPEIVFFEFSDPLTLGSRAPRVTFSPLVVAAPESATLSLLVALLVALAVRAAARSVRRTRVPLAGVVT